MPEQWTDYERERARQDAQDLMNLGAGWGQKLYPHQAKGPLSDFEPTIEDIQTTWSQGVGDTQFRESPDWRQSSFGVDPGNLGRALDKAQGKEIQPANIPKPAWGSWEKLDDQGKMAHMFQVVEKTMEEDKDFRNEVEYDFDQALQRRIPFVGSAAEFAEQVDLGDRAERITQGKGTPRDYLEIAKVMHNADYWEKEAGYGEHAVKDVSSILTFGAEFAMTAGTAPLAKKIGAKLATEVAKKSGLKALMKKYAGASVKKLLSPTNLKRSLVMGPAMAGATYHSGRGNIGQMEATQGGGFEFAEEEDSAVVDALEASAMAYAEIAIEELLPHGFVDKLTGGMKSKLTRGIAKLFGREASERTGKGIMSRAGLGSLAEELTEERMVELANTAITRDPDELGVLAGDLKAFSHEAVAMSLVQSPRFVSAMMPGRSRQQRIDRETPTAPPTAEDGQVIPLERQEVIPEEVVEPEQQYDHEAHIDMLATENRSSRREFEQVNLPDGTTLQDKYPSKAAREEFLEQRRAEIDAKDQEQAPVEEQAPTEPVAPVEEELPKPKKPYQQTEDEFIQSVNQGDVVNIEDPQMTDHEMNVLGGESKNVKMPVSSQQLPYVVKENPDGDLVAVVDNQVVGYARTVDGAMDLHVADDFKDHGMEQELTTLFQDMNPDVQDITNQARDTLLAGHALSVDQALKSGQPVPVGVAKIREAQKRLEATQAKIDDGRKVTPQLMGALTRAENNLDRARAEFGQEIPDRTSRVDELAQRVEEGRDLFTGQPLEGMEAAEAVIPEATKPKGSTIAQFMAERAEQAEQEIEPPPVIEDPLPAPVIDAEQDIEDVRVASGVTLQDIRREFRGMKVVEVEDGFIIHNPRGKIHVKLVEESELTDQQVMRIWDDHRKSTHGKKDFQRDKSGKWQTFEEVFPTAESYLEDFRTKEKRGEFFRGTIAPATKAETDSDFSLLATIRLNNTDWGRSQPKQMNTLRHELVHMAFNSGMWTAKERAALVNKYSDPKKSFRVQSEDIALASEIWETPGAIQKFTDFINRLLNKITGGVVKLTPKAVENLMFQEKFWDAETGREAFGWEGVMAEAQGMPSGKQDLQQTQDETKTQEQETTDDKQRSTGLPQQTQETSSQAGRFPDRGRLPRGSEQLSPLRRSSITSPALEGLPTKIAIRSYPDAVIEPDEVARTAAAVYMDRIGQEYNPPKKYAKVDKDLAGRIADWYDTVEHDPSNPKIAESYQAMIEETLAQWEVIKETGLTVEWIDIDETGNPYATTPREATEDIRRNNHFWVFPTDSGFGSEGDFDPKENPLFAYTDEVIDGRRVRANDIFRIVHDYFGHVKEGNGFRAGGEENAWRSHVAMYSDLAKPAMTMETRGQNSWLNFGPSGDFNRTADQAETVYAEQKVNIPPAKFVEQGATDAQTPMGQPTVPEGELPESQSRFPEGQSIPFEDGEVREVVKKNRPPTDVITEAETRAEVDQRRSENPNADQELLDRLSKDDASYNATDDLHAHQVIQELALSTKKEDMEFVGKMVKARHHARANASRVTGASWNRDPLERLSPPERRYRVIVEAIGAKNPDSREAWERVAGGKERDPTKAEELDDDARRAEEKEIERLLRMKEFVEGLGYTFDQKGFEELSKSRKDSGAFLEENREIMVEQGWLGHAADMITEYHLAAMLSGPRTAVVNVSSMAFGYYREMEQLLAATANSAFGNTEDIVLSDYKHYRPSHIIIGTAVGFVNGLKSIANFWLNKKFELIEEQVGVERDVDWDPKTEAIPTILGKAVRMFGYGPMTVGDQFFRTQFVYMNVGIQAARIARKEGLKGKALEDRVEELVANKRSKAWVEAMDEASARLFQDKGVEGGLSAKSIELLKSSHKIPKGGGFIARNVAVPFVKTPIRLPAQGFVRVPGLGFPVYGKIWDNMFGRDDKGNRKNKPPLEGVSNEVVGQVLNIAAAWFLWGLISCDDEKTKVTGAARGFDRSAKKFGYEKGVKEAQTVEILGVDLSYDKMDPAAYAVATTVDFLRSIKCGKSAGETALTLGKSAYGQLTEKTYGRGISDLVKIHEENGGKRWASSFISSWIPNNIQQGLRWMREGGNIGYNEDELIWDQAMKSSQLMESFPRYSHYGDMAVDTRSWHGYKTKSGEIYKGNRVFERYNDKYKDKPKVYPTSATPTYQVDGIEVRMPDKTFSEYSRLSGELARRVVDDMLPDKMAADPDSVTLKLVRKAISGSKELILDHIKANEDVFKTGNIDVDLDKLERKLKTMVRNTTRTTKPEPKRGGQTQELFEQQHAEWEEAKAARKRYNDWYLPRIGKIRQ